MEKDEEDEPFIDRLLGKEIETDVEDGDNIIEPIILSIEKTQRTDDLGKWYIITKKEHADTANKLIDEYLIPTAEGIIAYKDHLNDNDLYKLGI